MMREATTALTTLMLLAGCLAPQEEIEAADASFDSPLLASLGALPLPSTQPGDAIVLHTVASPEGGTTAFWWEIPEGVLVEDGEGAWVPFLAAPVLLEEDRAPLERWTIMAFLAKDGALALNSLAFGVPLSVSGGGLMSGGSEEIDRSLEPFLFGVGGKIKAGSRVGFVVSGVAADDVEMALVLLPLAKEWDDDKDLPEDTDAFLEHVGSAMKVALPASGTGGTHQVAFLFEGGGAFGAFSATAGPVERAGESTNALVAQRRMETISTAFDSGGYGIAVAGYYAQSAAGSWAAIADAHGSVSEADGPIVHAFGPALMGWPFVVAMGEGDAPSRTELSLQTTSAGFEQGLYVFQVDLDETLQELLGLPALPLDGMTGTGEATRAGDDLVLDVGGVAIRAVGMF